MTAPVFPAITPSARTWTPGQRPSGGYTSLSGQEVRIQYGNLAVGSRLGLAFSNRLDADGRLITDHFAAAQGTFDVFDLPAAIYAGMPSYGHVTPAGTKWRYESPPTVTYVMPGVVSLSVSLVAVPQ